ncbi:TPA: hypothetical protein ACH3X1_009516 [Trebouxia sp. C0004]
MLKRLQWCFYLMYGCKLDAQHSLCYAAGRHYVEEIVKLTTGVVTVIKTATLFFSMIILSAASHRLRATHAGSQHLGFEGCELTEAEEHQRILSELEDHQLRECMLQQGKCISGSFVNHQYQALWPHLMPQIMAKVGCLVTRKQLFLWS